MATIGIYHVAALALLMIPVCMSQSCTDAETCLAQLTSLSASTPCVDRLEEVTVFKKCVEDNKVYCDAVKQGVLQASLDEAIALFMETCADGCSDFVNKYISLTTTCTVSDAHMTEHINTAMLDWNRYNQTNETVIGELKRIFVCIEELAKGCGIIRKTYGKLFQQYPALPLIQQIFGIYKKVNGIDESSAILEDCPNLAWKDELTKIISQCHLGVEKDTSSNPDIIQFCPAMQTQIDCVLQWETKCPLAVTKFLSPFMESYGVIHTIFCNNITIHGFVLRSLSKACDNNAYRRAYKECWQPIMVQLQEGDADHSDINPRSLNALFNLQKYESTDGNICLVFRDQGRYNTTRMRKCTKELDSQCPLPFPTHGDPYPIPDGLLYDDALYTLINAGPMPFNEYGIVQLQYTRDHICYEGCDEYATMNTDFINECKNKIRTMTQELNTATGDQIQTKCKSLKTKITCISDKSKACPLFQYQGENLLDETKVAAALSTCGIKRPDLLPDDYTIKTTTLATPPSTAFWTVASNEASSVAATGASSLASCISRPTVLSFLLFILLIIVLKN